MQHDYELIICMRKTLKPFDADGNYQPHWIVYNSDYDRVFCSRFYYKNKSELLNVYFFRDGSVIISDQLNESVIHSSE
jgi:hypothetical protein